MKCHHSGNKEKILQASRKKYAKTGFWVQYGGSEKSAANFYNLLKSPPKNSKRTIKELGENTNNNIVNKTR